MARGLLLTVLGVTGIMPKICTGGLGGATLRGNAFA